MLKNRSHSGAKSATQNTHFNDCFFQCNPGKLVPECQTMLYVAVARDYITEVMVWKSKTLRFNGHLPGGYVLAGTRMSPFWILLQRRIMAMVVTTGVIRSAKLQSNHHYQHPVFLQAGCPFCRPTNSVKALKENDKCKSPQSNHHHQHTQTLKFSTGQMVFQSLNLRYEITSCKISYTTINLQQLTVSKKQL